MAAPSTPSPATISYPPPGTFRRMTTNARITTRALGALPAGSEWERKRRFVKNFPMLLQLTKENHCTEAELLHALQIVMFKDREYIFRQGQQDKDLYFVEAGNVLITTSPRAGNRRTTRRLLEQVQEEQHIYTYRQNDYFGELAFLQKKPRKFNAVASGDVTCMTLSENAFATLLAPLHPLLLYRNLIRSNGVLEKIDIFRQFTACQRQFMTDRCTLEYFEPGAMICRTGTINDRFFIVVEGEVEISREITPIEAHASTNSTGINTSQQARAVVVARKTQFQAFGEMGLLHKPRTANAVAVGESRCIVINRRIYVIAAQMNGAVVDVVSESLLATRLIEEWSLVVSTQMLHLSNPKVAAYLVKFVKRFKTAYSEKFTGKTLYLEFMRRLHQEPAIGEDFDVLASRISLDSPSSSLGIIRYETRRVLSKPPADRLPSETSFIGRMIERTAFLNKFDRPSDVDRTLLARQLGQVLEFRTITSNQTLFKQGTVEGKAFIILRGNIDIVNEDVCTIGEEKQHEVLATLSAGDSFGELTLVTKLPRTATAIAACDTDLLVLDRERLHLLQTALPGVSVESLMVKRTELLSQLSFFTYGDIRQCIRVAYDLHDVEYEPRQLFFQTPEQLNNLYIIKAGEIAVFLKRYVLETSRSGIFHHTVKGDDAPPGYRAVLVRVSTLGAREFFGAAIAKAQGPKQPLPTTPVVVASSSPSTTSMDVGSTIYMCQTHVQLLELSERGWRRLNPGSLHTLRTMLQERHEWHLRLAREQNEAPYYQLDRPWHQLPRSMFTTVQTETEPSLASMSGSPLPSYATVSIVPPDNSAIASRNSPLAHHLKSKRPDSLEVTQRFLPVQPESLQSSTTVDSMKREHTRRPRKDDKVRPVSSIGMRSPRAARRIDWKRLDQQQASTASKSTLLVPRSAPPPAGQVRPWEGHGCVERRVSSLTFSSVVSNTNIPGEENNNARSSARALLRWW